MALTDSLIESWELAEASGNAVGAHGGLTLTDTNGVGSGVGLVNSVARDFEADSDQYFTRGDGSELSTGDIDFTFEAWAKLESRASTTGVAKTILNKGDDVSGGADHNEYSLYVWTDNIIYLDVSNGISVGSVGATNFGSFIEGSFAQILAWHDSVLNTVNVRINNGAADAITYSGGSWDSGFDFRIGRGLGSGRKWDGLMGPVRFWKRVLTSGEQSQLWNSGAGLTYAALSGAAGPTAVSAYLKPNRLRPRIFAPGVAR